MTYKPSALPGYVIIRPISHRELTKSLLEIPKDSKEHANTGEVLDCGETGYIDGQVLECPVSKGNLVAYIKFGEEALQLGTEEYHIVRFDRLVSRLEKK